MERRKMIPTQLFTQPKIRTGLFFTGAALVLLAFVFFGAAKGKPAE
jgi:hypothetical protein